MNRAAARGLSFDVLMAYTRGETRRWYDWFEAHPEALDITIGDGATETVRDLIIHIFAMELRGAERLLDEPVSSLEALPTESIDDVWGIFGRARDKLTLFLARADDAAFERVVSYHGGPTGTISGRAHRIVGHLLVHGIRHWAQISTALRQQGYEEQWPHDLAGGEG
jgi:uncharacterized damage-inducible protein DinB